MYMIHLVIFTKSYLFVDVSGEIVVHKVDGMIYTYIYVTYIYRYICIFCQVCLTNDSVSNTSFMATFVL